MRLNHLDILEQCFRDKFKGYNKQEVDTFLHLVADDFKEMSLEIEQLKKEIERLKNQGPADSNSYNADPQITPELLKEKAKQMIRVAREQAESHKKRAEQELEALKKDIHKLTQEKSSLLKNLKESAREHLNQFKK
jgi:cell division initiation protein